MTGEDSARKLVADYVDGMARGDADLLRHVFHADASVIGHFDGGLEWTSLEDFITSCVTEAIPAGRDVPGFDTEAIDLDGDAGVVLVNNMWAGLTFRDWLSLLHHDGRWQIVAKLFRQID